MLKNAEFKQLEAIKIMKSSFSSFLCSGLFSVVSILSFPQITLAKLRLGIGIQPGLEGYFLEYQQQGLPLDNVGSNNDSVIVASQFLLEEPSLVTDTIANSPDEEATISTHSRTFSY